MTDSPHEFRNEKIERQSMATVPRYRKERSEFVPIPCLGPDIFDPRKVQLIKQHTLSVTSESEEPAKVDKRASSRDASRKQLSGQANARIEAAKARGLAKRKGGK